MLLLGGQSAMSSITYCYLYASPESKFLHPPMATVYLLSMSRCMST